MLLLLLFVFAVIAAAVVLFWLLTGDVWRLEEQPTPTPAPGKELDLSSGTEKNGKDSKKTQQSSAQPAIEIRDITFSHKFSCLKTNITFLAYSFLAVCLTRTQIGWLLTLSRVKKLKLYLHKTRIGCKNVSCRKSRKSKNGTRLSGLLLYI